MLIANLLIPLTMIGFGTMFIKSAPKKINVIFGYRTSMSMKNKETWRFAHQHCGNLWRKTGWIVLVFSIFTMIFLIDKDQDTIGIVGGILSGIQLVFLIGSIFPTERALKKTFDEQGSPRK